MAGIVNALKFASITTIGAVATLAIGTQAFANDGTNAKGPLW